MATGKKFISPQALQQNTMALGEVRLVALLAGGVALGVLGVTGLAGFATYLMLHILASAAVLSTLSWAPEQHFPQMTVAKMLTSGVFDNVLPFLLFWTLSYAFCHIYA